jgi:hypothetical protein
MLIGILVEDHHTEHIELFLELFNELGYTTTIYNDSDAYGNIEVLQKSNFKFQIKKLSEIGNAVLDRYIVLSHTDKFFNAIKDQPGNKDIRYLVHTKSDFDMITNHSGSRLFIVSKYISDSAEYIFLASRNNYKRVILDTIPVIADYPIDVVKLGWVAGDESGYRRLLDSGKVNLHIFTQAIGRILKNLLDSYPSGVITVYLKYKTDFVYRLITTRNIKFVYFNPSNIDPISGSITFALNNSMILLTNDKIIEKYSDIPKEYTLSIDDPNFTDEMKKRLVSKLNPSGLQSFREANFEKNLQVIKRILE